MPVSSKDLYEYASAIIKQNNVSEVMARTSISRAYYAAYHHCLNFCNHNNIAIHKDKDTRSHEALEKALERVNSDNQAFNNKAKNMGQKLKLAKVKRTEADYLINITVSQRRAQQYLSEVKRILSVK